MTPPEAEPTCRHHPDAPALAICADCGADICGECHAWDRRGFALCPVCRGESIHEVPDWESPEGPYTPANYVRTLSAVVRSPRSFFTRFAPDGRWMPAVAFGFVTVLLGLLVDRVWKISLDSNFEATLGEFAATESIPRDELQWLLFLSIPISALLVIGVHTAALKVAAGVAGAPLDWSRAARIAGYALGSFAFLLVPPVYGFEVGTFLAVFWLFNLEATALEHAYDFSAWRGTLTVLVPVLVAMMCAG